MNKVRVKANYHPRTGFFRFVLRDVEKNEGMTVDLSPVVFAQMVEYLDTVLASYGEAKANGLYDQKD